MQDLDPLMRAAGPDAAGASAAGTVIASCILNAAMIPGWPPPRFRDGLDETLREIADLAARGQGLSDQELAIYLANFGLDEHLLGRLRAAQSKPEGWRNPLSLLASLMQAFAHVLDTLREEVGTLAEDVAVVGWEQGDDDPAAPARGARRRLFLK